MNDVEEIEQAFILFDKVWGKTSINAIKNKHYNNPDRVENPISFYKENNIVLGMNGFLGMHLSIQNSIWKVAQSCESAVLPSARGKGIFTKIQKQAENELGKEGIGMLIGVPNDQSAPGFVKLGWKEIGTFHTFVLPIKIGNSCKIPILKSILNILNLIYFGLFNRSNGQIQVSNSLEEIQCYLSGKIDNSKIFFTRELDNLKWKIESSNLKYLCFKEGDKIVGVVIYYIKENTLGKSCFICEWEFEAGFERACIYKLYKTINCDCMFSLMVNVEEVPIWSHRGFISMKKKTSLIYKNLNLTQQEMINVNKQNLWRIRELDLDTILNMK